MIGSKEKRERESIGEKERWLPYAYNTQLDEGKDFWKEGWQASMKETDEKEGQLKREMIQ